VAACFGVRNNAVFACIRVRIAWPLRDALDEDVR
jgi:hypothetical protein